ncbi:MAG: type I-U CRISPR-associated protein Csx17 [Acidobacteriota bacterium]
MIRVELTGCSCQPLASYLKALGVLRLVSEQADADARGYWTGECFVLESELSRDDLVEFFLNTYRPTPVVAPWNGASGFYPKKDSKVGIDAITSSTDSRFEEYRAAIDTARDILKQTGLKSGATPAEEDVRRTTILRLCRNRLPDRAVEWLDAAIAIDSNGDRAFAPMFGTGGNEGHLDYTNNFMENLAGLLISPKKKPPVRSLLENALFGTATAGLQNIATGQYDPGRSGGFNQGQGISSDTAANPWNAVLTVEGAITWASGIYRKQGVSYRSILCSPFTVRLSAVGYGSAANEDGDAMRAAEIWTPLWTKPARYAEIRSLLREGRAAVGERPAKNGLEFAQAAAALGVDRAISGFVRYSILKRRGKSYIALPAGTFAVTQREESDLIREMAPLVEEAGRVAKGGQREAPKSWPPLRRAVEDAMYQVLLSGGPHLLCDVAAAFGAMHRWLLDRDRSVWFSGSLSAEWVTRCAQCDEKAAEVRIAAALASMRHPDAGTFLSNLKRGDGQFSWLGRDVPERMLNTLRRRVLSGRESERSPLQSGFVARLSDVTRFIEHRTDDRLIEDLAFAFATVKGAPKQPEGEEHKPWPIYLLLKHAFLPCPLETDNGSVKITPDLAVLSLLAAGRVDGAAENVGRRLRIAGLQPVKASFAGSINARRLGASLLIPVSVSGLERERWAILEPQAEGATTSR